MEHGNDRLLGAASLLGGALAYTLLMTVIYREACPGILRGANYNPMLHSGEIGWGVSLYLSQMLAGLLLSPILMAPYRVLYFTHRLDGLRLAGLLRLEALILYVPASLVILGLMLVFLLSPGRVMSTFLPVSQALSALSALLYIYSSLIARPWATARILISPTHSRADIILSGIFAALTANILGSIAGGLVEKIYNPIIWECSAKHLGIIVFNPRTTMLEKIYTVDIKLITTLLLVQILYYYLLVRLYEVPR